MSPESAIQVDNVSKNYLIFARPEDRLKQMIVPRLQRLAGLSQKRYFTDFAAVRDVSFKIDRGQTVGIVGRNGSGKSTLLQMVCGTLQPTSGSISVNGRIAALLELGAGFNPEFTGRENVYMNAAILGLSRAETDARYDDIVRFADIGLFIDQPVKTYSSGMYIRLAFAVAINVDPDILIVDEALSVGDEAFQRKCFARIEQIKASGATILFVSHGAQTIVQLCDRAILMDQGEMILDGSPKKVVTQYQRLINLSGDDADRVRREIRAMGTPENRPGSEAGGGDLPGGMIRPVPEAGTDRREADEDLSAFDERLVSTSRVEYEQQGARLCDVRITAPDGRQVNLLQGGRTYQVRYAVEFTNDVGPIIVGMQAKTISGFMIAGANNERTPVDLRPRGRRGGRLDVVISFECLLLPGTYMLDVGVKGENAFAHRVIDSLMFRVLPQPDLDAVGHFNLNPRIAVEIVALETGELIEIGTD